MGRERRQVVELRDLAGEPIVVEQVACSDTDRLAARIQNNFSRESLNNWKSLDDFLFVLFFIFDGGLEVVEA